MESILVPEVIECGRFDSRIKFGENITITEDRPVRCFEIELYTKNGGRTYLNGKDYPIRSGWMLCAKPGSKRHSRLPFKCYYLYLSDTKSEITDLLRKLPNTLEIGNLKVYINLFHEIIRASISHDESHRCLLYSSVLKLISHMKQDTRHNQICKNGTGLSANREALMEAEKFICRNYSKRMTLNSLATAFNFSPIYFHKLFSKYFGKTPYQYQLECRIAAAKESLLTTEKSLCSIAEECGFSSQSYFHNQFKKEVGQTPLGYRNWNLSLRYA